MVKKLGLSRDHKKLVKFAKFSESLPKAAMFYNQAKSFFRVFKKSFGMGYESVKTNPNGKKFYVANQDITANLMVFHFAIELLLKALLSLKSGKLHEKDEHHKIKDLLVKVAKEYEVAQEILENHEYILLLEELGNNYNGIRYAEGSVCLRHNNKKGWKDKKPLQELSEAIDFIYKKLCTIFEEERLSCKAPHPVLMQVSNTVE